MQGREGWLSSLILVWGGDSTLYSDLDRLVDQLVEMVVQLTPLTNVGVGDMVVARFTDRELVRFRRLCTILTTSLPQIPARPQQYIFR